MPVEILNYTVAIVGHEGHGKSALLKAINGSLPAEQTNGDLKYRAIRLKKYHLSVVDVPGAPGSIRQILAGVGAIDLAILAVAANQGWMAQTEEHFQILNYLAVDRAIVAITKSDLIENVDAIRAQVTERVKDSRLAKAWIVPTSILRPLTIDKLKSKMADLIARTLPQRDLGKPRLAIENYTDNVATGTLIGGSFRIGQSVVVQPSGATAQIQAANAYGTELKLARPGARVDLALTNVQGNLVQGNVITIAELNQPTGVIDLRIKRAPSAQPAMKQDTEVCIHYGSAVIGGRVHFLTVESLSPGEKTLVRVTLQSPVLALMHDRFVIRDLSQQNTLAGGVVLDPDPPPEAEGPRALVQLAMLKARANSPPNPANFMASQLARDGVGERATFLMRSRFSKRDLDAAADRLIAAKLAVITGDIIADSGWWDGLRRLTIGMIDEQHRQQPDKPGLAFTLLRPAAAATLPTNVQRLSRPLLEALLGELCNDGFARTSAFIHRVGHQQQTSPRLISAAERMRSLLDENPLDPPSRVMLCKSPVASEAMKFLITGGQAVDIAADVVLTADAYTYAVDTIRQHLEIHGSATVAQLLELLSSSRRVIVPLLAKLDRENITHREGDGRRLVQRQIAGPAHVNLTTPPPPQSMNFDAF